MKKSAIYAIVAVIVIIIIIVAAVILFVPGIIPGPSASPTPTPTASTAPGAQVGSATNLTYTANVTSNGATTEYKWAGKDIHSNNETLRVDFANYVYIMDAGQQKSWISTDTGATFTASDFTADWTAWSPQWSTNIDNLTHWTTGDSYSYTDATGATVVMFNIAINPAIPASTFTVP